MRIFLAGATGVIGSRLLPLLVESGHEVAGMTRSATRVADIVAGRAHPVVCDVFDAAALRIAVTEFRPDVVVHQLTDLPDDAAELPSARSANARMRRDGTRNLLAAARAANVPRFLAQSVAWDLFGEGLAAKEYLERSVLASGGIVIRYGQFYGPGTYYEAKPPMPPRIQIDDAARRTVSALSAPSGIITLTEMD